MSKYIFLTFAVICITLQLAKAQNNCPPSWSGSATPPNVFDWLQRPYTNYYSNTTTSTAVENPYYATSSTSVLPISQFAIKDMQPDDGWELVKHKLGVDVNHPNDIPFLAMYNKYRGVIRVFFLPYLMDVNSQSAMISMSYDQNFLNPVVGSNFNESALLGLSAKAVKGLDEFERRRSFAVIVPTSGLNIAQGWVYAEFPMLYDPCACNTPSRLFISITGIQTSNISMNGTIVSSGQSASTSNNFAALLGYLESVVEKGMKVGDSWDKVETAINGLNTASDKTEQTIKDDFGQLIQSLISNATVISKAIPAASATFNALDFITSGGLQFPKPTTANATETKIILSGTITTNSSTYNVPLITPGSDASTYAVDLQPDYKRIMGIVNLLETPKIVATSYSPEHYNPRFYRDGICGSCEYGQYSQNIAMWHVPNLLEFRFLENPKLLINTDAGLVLEDAVVSLEATFPPVGSGIGYGKQDGYMSSGRADVDPAHANFLGPVEMKARTNFLAGEDMNDYDYRCRSSGFKQITQPYPDTKNLLRLSRYATTAAPINDSKALVLRVWHSNSNVFSTGWAYDTSLFCRVTVKLKRADGLGVPIYWSTRYKVKIAEAETKNGLIDLKFTNEQNYDMLGSSFATDIKLADMNYVSSHYDYRNDFPLTERINQPSSDVFSLALEDVVVSAAVTGGTIRAPLITLNPGAEISPETELKAQSFFNSNPASAVVPASALFQSSSSFCLDQTKYKPLTTVARRDQESEPIYEMLVAPNPSKLGDPIRFSYRGSIKANVTLTDVMGHIIPIEVSIMGQNLYDVTHKVTSPGVYILSVTTSQGVQRKRVVLQ